MSLQGSQMESDDPTTSYMLQVELASKLSKWICLQLLLMDDSRDVNFGYSIILQAWARLCKCLGQDFLPYMSVVMPPLLQSAQLKPDVTITSADSDNDIEDSDDERYLA